MALSAAGKLGVSAALGVGTTLAVDSGLQYWTYPYPLATDGKSLDVTKDPQWFNKYSSLLGGAAALVVAAILYKVWGAEEAIVAAIAGIGTAVAAPAHTWVAETATENRTFTGLAALRQLAAVRQLQRVA